MSEKKQVQVVDQTTHPPKCHSFVGLDRQIGSSPPANLRSLEMRKFYICSDVTRTHINHLRIFLIALNPTWPCWPPFAWIPAGLWKERLCERLWSLVVPWLDAKGRSSEALQMLEGRVRRLAVNEFLGWEVDMFWWIWPLGCSDIHGFKRDFWWTLGCLIVTLNGFEGGWMDFGF